MRKRLSKEQKRFVRELFRASFTDGRLDARKVSAISHALAQYKPSQAYLFLMAYKELVILQRKKEVASVYSPATLTDAEKHRILTTLKRLQPEVHTLATYTDPSLLGGVRIQLGDTYYDTTISTKLSTLRGT